MRINRKMLITLSAVGIVSFVLGATIDRHFWRTGDSGVIDESCVARLPHLNPLVICRGWQPPVDKRGYAEFRSKLMSTIKQLNVEESTEMAVYFRDLMQGPTMGINENDPFAPASLLKVPLMIAYYKLAETNPAVLDTQVTLRASPNDVPAEIDTIRSVLPDTPYRVEELIEKMIIYSDNVSKDLLQKHLASITSEGEDLLNQTYVALGLSYPGRATDDYVTVKQYSTVFLILYNASYLNEEMSEKALSLLERVEFPYGLVAGLPLETPTAHKFGDRVLEGDRRQLHDCGIVYFPGNPYLICVMTRGRESQSLFRAIESISRNVYDEFLQRSR